MTSVTAIVLAGGKGSRLGGVDKALLEIGGRRTIDRVLGALDGLATDVVAVVNEDRLADVAGIRRIADPEPHAGVLPALQAALSVAREPLCLLVACDMPFLQPALLRRLVELAEGYDVVIPHVDGQPQPMHAVYRRDPCRGAIAESLARGQRRMIAFLDAVRVRTVPEDKVRSVDPDLRSFFNVNTPEDLERARALATG
ncbi:MAG: molybdenum cofactor guanylyltransferase [Chloroflexota bacterium]|nr:molybdenum cofactor guanylyltransferase [Chloroflexota bacterium]